MKDKEDDVCEAGTSGQPARGNQCSIYPCRPERRNQRRETMTTYYCVTVADDTVGPEVMRMRISRSGNLVDAGGHHRWPAGAHSLGSDRGQWPTLHATAEAAEAERAALAASCRHDWRHTDDEAICSRCGQVEPQYDQPPAADSRQGGNGNPCYRRRLSVDELRRIAEAARISTT